MDSNAQPLAPPPPPPTYAAPQPVQPHKSRKKMWVIIILSVLLVIFLGIVGCCVLIFSVAKTAMKSSQVYKMSVDRAQASPCAMSKLGTPITAGIPNGSINEANGSGTADYTISVTGPQGNGSLHVIGARDNSVWTITTETLNVNGTDYDLPADPAPCSTTAPAASQP